MSAQKRSRGGSRPSVTPVEKSGSAEANPLDRERGMRRLLLLVEHLKGVKDEDFDISSWRKCAIGHACNVVFRRNGLKLSGGIPSYRGLSDWEAVSSFFSLSFRETLHLFGTSFLRTTPEMVSDRIVEFVKKENENHEQD